MLKNLEKTRGVVRQLGEPMVRLSDEIEAHVKNLPTSDAKNATYKELCVSIAHMRDMLISFHKVLDMVEAVGRHKPPA